MGKRLLFLALLAALLSFALLFSPLFSHASAKALVIDETDSISEGRLESLNVTARAISSAYNADVAFFLVSGSYAPTQTIEQYARELYLDVAGLGPDGFALVHDVEGRNWTMVSFGKADELVFDAVEDSMWEAYDEEETISGGVRAYLDSADIFLEIAVETGLWEAGGAPVDADALADGPGAGTEYAAFADEFGAFWDPDNWDRYLFIMDEPGLLTDAQWREAMFRLEALYGKYRCDVRIVVVDSMELYGYNDPGEFAYGIYTRLGLGYSAGRDCVLFVMSMAGRDYDLKVWGGYAETVFTLYGIDSLLDKHMLPRLRNDNYNGAFTAFFDRSQLYFEMAEDGNPFNADTDNSRLPLIIAVVAIASLATALIVFLIFKSQMKAARLAGRRTATSRTDGSS